MDFDYQAGKGLSGFFLEEELLVPLPEANNLRGPGRPAFPDAHGSGFVVLVGLSDPSAL
jgi:hypothetical protein